MGRAPANAYQEDVEREAHDFGNEHFVQAFFSQDARRRLRCSPPAGATEPVAAHGIPADVTHPEKRTQSSGTHDRVDLQA